MNHPCDRQTGVLAETLLHDAARNLTSLQIHHILVSANNCALYFSVLPEKYRCSEIIREVH